MFIVDYSTSSQGIPLIMVRKSHLLSTQKSKFSKKIAVLPKYIPLAVYTLNLLSKLGAQHNKAKEDFRLHTLRVLRSLIARSVWSAKVLFRFNPGDIHGNHPTFYR